MLIPTHRTHPTRPVNTSIEKILFNHINPRSTATARTMPNSKREYHRVYMAKYNARHPEKYKAFKRSQVLSDMQ